MTIAPAQIAAKWGRTYAEPAKPIVIRTASLESDLASAGEHQRRAIGGDAEEEPDDGLLADARSPVDEAREQHHPER